MKMPRILTNIKLIIIICVTIGSAIAIVPYPYNILMVSLIIFCIVVVANISYDAGTFVGSFITSQFISQILQSEVDNQRQSEKETAKE